MRSVNLFHKPYLLRGKTISIGIHPSLASTCKLADGFQRHRIQTFLNPLFKFLKRIIAILPRISFHCCPVELNKVQFTMKFRAENAFMALRFDQGLKHGDFTFKIRLVFQDPEHQFHIDLRSLNLFSLFSFCTAF